AFFAYLAHDSLPHAFVLYSAHRFGFDERAIGLGLTLAGASSLVVQGRVVGAFGERRALLGGLLVGLAGQLILGLAPVPALFLVGLPVWSLFGLVTPLLYTQVFAAAIGPFASAGLPGAPFVLSALFLAASVATISFAARRSPAAVRPS